MNFMLAENNVRRWPPSVSHRRGIPKETVTKHAEPSERCKEKSKANIIIKLSFRPACLR